MRFTDGYRLILVLTIILLMASTMTSMNETVSSRSMVTQVENSTDISGKWNSNIGHTYQITQKWNSFSWIDLNTNIEATGLIRGGQLNAEWADRRAKHSVTGKITEYDSSGRPIRIEWSNNVVFHRKPKAQAAAPNTGWCCQDGDVFMASANQCKEQGGKFFKTREEAEEFCQAGKADLGELEISDLKGPNWKNYVDRTVTVEGIFVRDPLPMLVTELDIVMMNKKMPEEKYVVLLGNNAEEIDPKEFGGARVRIKGVLQAVDDREKYGYEYAGLMVKSYEMIDRLEPYVPENIAMDIPPEPAIPQENRYAILFGGGIDKVNNHIRYWNDLKFMYSTLITEYGYTSSTIAVLYANGKAEDKDMPVHYSATQANLEKVFNLLKGVTTPQDFIFVFTTNHGGGFHKDSLFPLTSSGTFCGRLDTSGDEGNEGLDEKTYSQDFNGNGKIQDKVSWDEELCAWNGSIYDDDLTPLFTNLKYNRIVIVMEQCFSGGIIPEMAGNNRIVMSAAGEFEPSWCLKSKTYDEFSYYFTCAINGADPDGKQVDADTDNDGEVSMVEAFNYARSKDTRNETPWYEDNGDGIPHSGNMPKGGDGALGDTTSLE